MTILTKEERDVLLAKPACFSDKEWKEWSKHAERCRPSVVDWACTDCTPEFKAEAQAEGRCSWQCVTFVTNDDGGIEGRRMSVYQRHAKPEDQSPAIGTD
jgi:hypothetical protein